MNVVAAPLYCMFLTDAQAAARSGDTARMRECLGLALDFVPDEHRERVLLIAAELAAAAGASNAPPADPAPSFEVRVGGHVEPGGHRRIAWVDAPAFTLADTVPAPAYSAPPAAPVPRRSKPYGVVCALIAVLAAGAVVERSRGGAEAPRWMFPVLGIDPVAEARSALRRGEPDAALRLLDRADGTADSEAWLLRAAAYEARSDRAAAVRALSAAAASDASDGKWALEAGDHLQRLGASAAAADAYLYAVSPTRTETEIERIARAQELAGHADRATRVRQAR